MKKRILSLFLVLLMVVSIVPFSAVESKAAGLTLAELKAKFPNGKYWNHYVSSTSEAVDHLKVVNNEKYADTTTSYQCALHGEASLSYYVGKYDCNYFDGGIQ